MCQGAVQRVHAISLMYSLNVLTRSTYTDVTDVVDARVNVRACVRRCVCACECVDMSTTHVIT